MTTPAKKASTKDWHSADIKAALDKAGWSLNQLGLAHGYTAQCAVGQALRYPYPKAERIIADALNLHPMVIWPSRYDANGNPNRPRGRRPKRPVISHLPTTGKVARLKGGIHATPCNTPCNTQAAVGD